MFFKIKCKIIYIYSSKKIRIIINNDDDILKFSNFLNKNKTKIINNESLNFDNNKYNLKITNKTKIIIDSFINYNNINDLLNLNVIISGYSKFYSFNPNIFANDIDHELEEKKNEINNTSNNITGYYFVATKIINHIDYSVDEF